jgi:hypothetical protein
MRPRLPDDPELKDWVFRKMNRGLERRELRQALIAEDNHCRRCGIEVREGSDGKNRASLSDELGLICSACATELTVERDRAKGVGAHTI